MHVSIPCINRGTTLWWNPRETMLPFLLAELRDGSVGLFIRVNLKAIHLEEESEKVSEWKMPTCILYGLRLNCLPQEFAHVPPNVLKINLIVVSLRCLTLCPSGRAFL